MKKEYLLLFLITFQGLLLFGQAKPFRFGINLSPNIGWFTTTSDGYRKQGSSPGFSLGMIGDFRLADNYFFGSGFNLTFHGGKLNFDDKLSIPGKDTIAQVNVLRTYSMGYFDIPVTIKMTTNRFGQLKYYGQIGFTGGFQFQGNATDKFTFEGTRYEVDRNLSTQTATFKSTFILGGGIEFYIDESTSFIGGLKYSNGFTNILNTRNPITQIKPKATPNYLELTLGVIF